MSLLMNKIDSIVTGKSKITGFTDAIVISSFNFGAQMPQTANGAYSGFPVCQLISITRQTDASSVQMLGALGKQTSLPSIVLSVTKVVANVPKAYFIITLTNAKFISTQMTASSPDSNTEASLQESFLIEYSKIKIEFAPLNAAKTSLGTSIPVTLDRVTKEIT